MRQRGLFGRLPIVQALLGLDEQTARPARPQVSGPSFQDYAATPERFPQVAASGGLGRTPVAPVQPVLRRPEPIAPPVPVTLQGDPSVFMRGGPGDLTPPQGGDLSAMAPRQFSALRGVYGDYGAQAGRLANATRLQPRLPDMGGDNPASAMPWYAPDRTLARVGAATGVSERYLDNLIGHESGGDDEARAGTSSATGAAQFTDATWLRMMRQLGPQYGLPRDVSDRQLLGLRSSRSWAGLMAGEYARENQAVMQRALRRPITQREAYLGHFLGGDEAADLIAAGESNMQDARRFVSRGAVEANPQVFYEGGRYQWRTHGQTGRRYQHYMGGGRARTAREVVALQGRNFTNEPLSQ